MYQISECLTEKDVSYIGSAINNGLANKQPDFASCRSSCKSMGAQYFGFNYAGNRGCYCKNSNGGEKQQSGVISGETSCSGEMSIQNCC